MTDGNLIDQEDTMEVFLLGLNTVVPIFIMMVAGYILARAGIIDEQMNVDLSKLYNALLLPATLFVSAYSSNVRDNVGVGIIAFGVVGALIYAVIGRLLFPPKEGNKQQFVWNHAIYRGNLALFGIAMTERMYPDGDLSNMILCVAICVTMVSTLCEVQLSSYSGKKISISSILKKVLTSPIVLSSVIGLLLSILAIRLPAMVFDPISSIGKAATPIGFVSLGASLNLKETGKYLKKLFTFVALRQVIAPLLFVAVGCGLLGFRGMDTVFILALLGSPPAVVTYATAKANHNTVDSDLAGQLVAFNTLMAVFTNLILIMLVSHFGLL